MRIDAGISEYCKLTSSSPTLQARAKLLHKSESQFQKSDESAYSIDSIVPSRMSASTGRIDSYVSDQDADIVQSRRLSFEKGLFMSRVYMRNCKNVMAKEIFKARLDSKRKVGVLLADQTAKNWEAIRDQIEADSLLARSCEESIDDTNTIRSCIRPDSRHRSSEEVVPSNQIEGDSMLARSCEQSINNTDTIRSQLRSESRNWVSEDFMAPSVSGGVFDNELIRSCEQGDSLQAQWLAVRGVDLHAHFKKGSYSGLTAIHVAAIHGHIDVVKVLLSCGANIEGESASERRRPLHLAAMNKQYSMVKFLIREGAQLDSVSETARKCGSKSLEILLSRSDPAYQNIEGRTLLHTLAQSRWRSLPTSSNVLQMCQLLLNRGVDVNHKDISGNQVLHCLASNKSGDVATMQGFAKLLLDRGAAVNATNEKGYTPLYLAIYFRNRQLSRLLVQSGSYTLKTRDGFLAEGQTHWMPDSPTPFHIFCIRRSDTSVENLKESAFLKFELSLDDHGYFTESAMDLVRRELPWIGSVERSVKPRIVHGNPSFLTSPSSVSS